MHATIDGKGQLVIPAQARKEARIEQGDIMEVQSQGEGRIVLVRLERGQVEAPAKITFRDGTHAVGSTGRRVTTEQIRELLNEPAGEDWKPETTRGRRLAALLNAGREEREPGLATEGIARELAARKGELHEDVFDFQICSRRRDVSS